MKKHFAVGGLQELWASLRRELRAIHKYRRKAPEVRFDDRQKLSLVVLLLLFLLGVAIGAYLFANYKGEIWDV